MFSLFVREVCTNREAPIFFSRAPKPAKTAPLKSLGAHSVRLGAMPRVLGNWVRAHGLRWDGVVVWARAEPDCAQLNGAGAGLGWAGLPRMGWARLAPG